MHMYDKGQHSQLFQSSKGLLCPVRTESHCVTDVGWPLWQEWYIWVWALLIEQYCLNSVKVGAVDVVDCYIHCALIGRQHLSSKCQLAWYWMMVCFIAWSWYYTSDPSWLAWHWCWKSGNLGERWLNRSFRWSQFDKLPFVYLYLLFVIFHFGRRANW